MRRKRGAGEVIRDASGLYGFHNTYFQPDEKKSGRAYVTITDSVKKIDGITTVLIMHDEHQIPIKNIIGTF